MLGWPKGEEKRLALVDRVGEDDLEEDRRENFGLTGAPLEIDGGILKSPEGGVMIWNRDADAIFETSDVEELPWKGERSPRCNLHRMSWSESRRRVNTCPDWKAIGKPRSQEWETSMRRSANDVRKAKRPALKRHEWMLIEKEVTWHEYKGGPNVQA